MFGAVRGRFFPGTLVVALNFLLVMVSFSLLVLGQTKDTTPLQRAMRDGAVVAIFKGTGGSSGDSVEVVVAKTARAGPGRLDLTIPPGSMLHSSNGAEQSMVIMGVEGRSTGGGMFEPTSHITVSTAKPVSYILSAFCAEFEKENPSTTDTFTLEEPVPILACLAREGKTLSVAAQQAAVWQYTDRMTYGRVNEKFAVSQTEWAAASSLLEHCRSNAIQPNSGTTTSVPEEAGTGQKISTLPSARVSANKPETPKQTAALQGRNDQMQTGVLAIVSDEAGTLVVDDVQGPKLLPNQVVTLKLVAGQHFAELRDDKNQKRWEKVIDVPVGAQVAEKVDLHSGPSGAVSRGNQEAPPVSQDQASDTATWTDQSTGLMWARHDNGTDVDWNQAMSYCRTLTLGGHSDWRLPEVNELESLYDPSATSHAWYQGKSYTYHIKGGIELTGIGSWSATRNGSSDPAHAGVTAAAWVVGFPDGKRSSQHLVVRLAAVRALCTRPASK